MSALSDDPYLGPHLDAIRQRRRRALDVELQLAGGPGGLNAFASGHEYFGLHRRDGGWVFREWAPNASAVFLVGDFSGWQERDGFALRRLNAHGEWELRLPPESLRHGDLYRLRVHWEGGEGDRIPAWARRVVQDANTKIFNAQVWAPPSPYQWRTGAFKPQTPLLIYEAHAGMAQEREGVGTWNEFTAALLPRIARAGYNAVQLMAVMEHPYYGSFGYHVSSFFAVSSRFGTPEEFKNMVDTAHELGIAVLIDLVHSHAASNEVEGLGRFDGTPYQFFHEGARGQHQAWGSRCFDYGKPGVLHFLLSNCRFWLDEYKLDGFRFDGVTSMLYHHHGLGKAFSSYADYFGGDVDADALSYLTLANKLIHAVQPDAITIAEDVSGLPGLAAPAEDCGCGFDYRLAMGVPDCWFKLVKDVRDEQWDMSYLWHELVNRRPDERTVNYAESHDQALVGGKTLAFEMMDAAMYDHMHAADGNLQVARGMALHKMIRLATLGSAGHGYLNFMGNEFGHPEWIDFPREGNSWSFRHARRQWSLRDNPELKYGFLAAFDEAMLRLAATHALPGNAQPRLLFADSGRKMLVFERCGLFFLFNFHPHDSLADFQVEVPPGEFELLLDTDEARFGGQNRLAPRQRYIPARVESGGEFRYRISVYLPCRAAMVLLRR